MRTVTIPIPSNIEIRRGILKFIGFALICYVAYVVREIWLPLVLALILALVLDPVVDRMELRGWNRTRATAFIFVSFLLIVGGLLALSAPYLMSQVAQMQQEFERYFPDPSKSGLIKSFHKMNLPDSVATIGAQALGTLQGALQKSTSSLAEYGMQFAGNLVWVVIIPIVTFYMLRDFHIILAKSLLVVPNKSRPFIQSAVTEITAIFGKYLRGLAIVSVLNGIATAIVLEILRVPSALLLGIIAGILYSVPYIGAILTVALTAAVAFIGGGIHLMLITVGVSIVLHQIVFDQIISPRVLGGNVGLHPILSIIALLIGNLLLGIVGMVLAVPVAACIQIAVLAVLPKLAIEVEIPPATERSIMAEEGEPTSDVTASEQMKQVVANVVEGIEADLDKAASS